MPICVRNWAPDVYSVSFPSLHPPPLFFSFLSQNQILPSPSQNDMDDRSASVTDATPLVSIKQSLQKVKVSYYPATTTPLI